MRSSSTVSLPSLSIRIDLDPECRIGPGKILLLEHIQTCGSISAACRAMDMSYQRAWKLVDEINRTCRRAAVEPGTSKNEHRMGRNYLAATAAIPITPSSPQPAIISAS